MKKLMSPLEDTATITITGQDAVRLFTLLRASTGRDGVDIYNSLRELLPTSFGERTGPLGAIGYHKVQDSQEAKAFPQESKKDLMLKELQSKMDALQCEIDKIKGESF